MTTVVLGIVLNVIDFGVRQTDFYDPEPSAPVEAQWQLSRVVPRDRDALKPLEGQRHMQIILRSLHKAQVKNPEHLKRIQRVRAKIVELQAAGPRIGDN